MVGALFYYPDIDLTIHDVNGLFIFLNVPSLLQLQGALDSGIPTHLSYGFVSGFCSGYALKKVGKAVSVVLGMEVYVMPVVVFPLNL